MMQNRYRQRMSDHMQQHKPSCTTAGDFKASHMTGGPTAHSTVPPLKARQAGGVQAVLAGVVCRPGGAMAGAEVAARPVPWLMCESRVWEQQHREHSQREAISCRLRPRREEADAPGAVGLPGG